MKVASSTKANPRKAAPALLSHLRTVSGTLNLRARGTVAIDIVKYSDNIGGMSVSSRHPPQVDPKVIEFMRQAGCVLEGWDPENEYNVVWRRQPIAQGDGGNQRFTTPAALKHDDYFYVSLLDYVFDSGVITGRRQLKEELRRLLDPATR